MGYKLGLKLWSVNTDYYYDEAIRLYEKGLYSYIELYVVPNTLGKLEKWKNLSIPFMLHAPHFMHGVNLANSSKFEYNKKVYEEVEQYNSVLNSKYTVVHGGIEGSVDETIRQLKIIQPKNMLIENKPYKAPLGDRNLCRGYSKEEIERIMNEVGCGFCLDIGHAICTANSLKQNQYKFLEEFNKLKPKMYHISDGDINSDVDMHLHFKSGNYDFNKIFDIIDDEKYISVETNKNSKTDLEDFIDDVEYINEK